MAGISLILQNNPTVTQINCGTSSPKLSGTIDISAFSNLKEFRCNSNDITDLNGYAGNSNLRFIQFTNNKITGSIPTLSANTQLRTFNCHTNQLSGVIPDISNNTELLNFVCHNNKLSGSIPSLNTISNLEIFQCFVNQLTGNIPPLSSNTKLIVFDSNTNNLTGSIPSLSANTALTIFLVRNNQLTGWDGGTVSVTLGNFQAQNNQLTSTAVNAILAAFVAAGRIGGTLNLGGTNSAPTNGVNNSDKLILESRGWLVTVTP